MATGRTPFGEAIQADPEQAEVGSPGESPGQQGEEIKAARFTACSDLLDQQGTLDQSEQIKHAVSKLQAEEVNDYQSGNGLGSALLRALSTLEALAPLALKTLTLGDSGSDVHPQGWTSGLINFVASLVPGLSYP